MTLLIYDPLVWQAAAAMVLVIITTWVIVKRRSGATTKSSSSVPTPPPSPPPPTASPNVPASSSSTTSRTSSSSSSSSRPSISPKVQSLLPLLSNTRVIPPTDRIICDGHALYNESRALWNGMIDKKPLAFVRVQGVMDVIHTVKYATERKIAVSVKGGGHNIAGTALVHGGMVIDMHYMRSVHVDVSHQLVTVQGGATWYNVDRECAIHGLAVVGGLISSTGVIGLTIGGGIGWLSRTYGLACDSLVSVDIVLANGTAITATADNEYANVFWCHHGGGGNFGVVTAITLRAHRLTPSRAIVLPVPPSSSSPSSPASSRDMKSSSSAEEYDAPVGHACLQWPYMNDELLIAFDALAASLPSTVAAYCFLQRFPRPPGAKGATGDDEQEPHPYHTIMMFVNNHGMVYGEKDKYTHHDPSILESQLVTLLGDLIAAHPPRSMDITVMEYTQLQCMFDAGSPFGERWRWKSCFVHNDITSSMATDIIACLRAAPEGTSLEIQRLRGAIITGGTSTETKHGRRESANISSLGTGNKSVFGHRDAYYEMHTISRWTKPSLDGTMATFAKRFGSTMASHIAHDGGGGYANYYTHDTTSDDIRASFGGAHYEQLQAAKLRYDPTNVFSSNQNISLPSLSASS